MRHGLGQIVPLRRLESLLFWGFVPLWHSGIAWGLPKIPSALTPAGQSEFWGGGSSPLMPSVAEVNVTVLDSSTVRGHSHRKLSKLLHTPCSCFAMNERGGRGKLRAGPW